MLAILLSLKTKELLENRLQPRSGVTPLFSMRTVLFESSQNCRSGDADIWRKRALGIRSNWAMAYLTKGTFKLSEIEREYYPTHFLVIYAICSVWRKPDGGVWAQKFKRMNRIYVTMA